jgi:hypothetical protein
MRARLWGTAVDVPTTGQPSSPTTRGWRDFAEPANDPVQPAPHFVPRRLVHKTTAGHVLVTGAIRLGENSFLVSAALPPDHGLYHQDGAGRTDPMLVAEAARQATYYVQHHFYDVPDSHQFILGELGIGLDDTAPLAAGSRWLPLDLMVTCTPTTKRTPRRRPRPRSPPPPRPPGVGCRPARSVAATRRTCC